uniref:CSON014276 protein n=1 Tax=Culicoides sonorensis TaxID=179676 RepID=A0A336MFV2_CULSO
MLGSTQREAVRVKVKKCEGNFTPEYKKFSVDPQITSVEVLYSILAKAFDIKSDFGISYKTKDPSGQEQWLVVLSDWDLDAAFLRAHNLSIVTASEPCLNLKVEVKPFQEQPAWENAWISGKVDAAANISQQLETGHKYLMSTVEKGFSIFQKALNFVEDPAFNLAPIPPLSDMDFRKYCDSVGQIIHADDLRRMIYLGGIDSSLRRVLWKLLLNVYPDKMTGKERMDYMKRKSNEYIRLREVWRTELQKGNTEGELSYVTSMVRKDVLRTDRLHPFYAGSDDNQNVAALFNILTTYSLNHPSVSYCQGMSDFCSCILVSMHGDEAQAYICFCALMRRIKPNFMIDGIAMTQKFAHLSEAFEYYDPEFYAYMKLQQADDLLFCYRWLLLEMKREFAFDDALFMLEVLWSTIPPNPPENELPLFEKEFVPAKDPLAKDNKTPLGSVSSTSAAVIMRKPRENAYTKVCALRRQSSSMSICSNSSPPADSYDTIKCQMDKRLHQSLDENVTRERILERSKPHLSLDETKLKLLKQQKAISQSMDDTEKIEDPEEVFILTERSKENHDTLQSNTNPFLDCNGKSTNDQCITDFLTYNNTSGVNTNTSNSVMTTSSDETTISLNFSYKKRELTGLMGGQINDLKEKLNASKKGIIASLDKIEKEIPKNKPKLVKNFNEFWNIASMNKNTIQDKINTTTNNALKRLPSVEIEENSILKPLVKFTKTNLDDVGDDESENERKGDSSPDDSQDYVPMTTPMTRELRLKMESLDRQIMKNGSPASSLGTSLENYGYSQLNHNSGEENEDLNSIQLCNDQIAPKSPYLDEEEFTIKTRVNSGIFFWENPLCDDIESAVWNVNTSNTCEELKDLAYDGGEIVIEQTESGKKSVTPIKLVRNSTSHADDSDSDNSIDYNPQAIIAPTNPFYDHINFVQNTSNSIQPTNQSHLMQASVCEEAAEDFTSNLFTQNDESIENATINKKPGLLPPPNEFGSGNPFLMFLCLTMLMQHRDTIMRSKMDYNEMAIHFDKMVRKHSVHRVLNQARKMYGDYLRNHYKCTDYYKIARNEPEENGRYNQNLN